MAQEPKKVVGKLYLGEEVTRSSEPELTFTISYSQDTDSEEIEDIEANYYQGDRIVESGIFSRGNSIELDTPNNIKSQIVNGNLSIYEPGGFFGQTVAMVKFDQKYNEFYTGTQGVFSSTKKVVAVVEFEDNEDFIFYQENFADTITDLGYFVWQKLEEGKDSESQEAA